MVDEGARIHSTAEVSPKAKIGKGTSVWNWAQIRDDVEIGEKCVIAKGVSIDSQCRIGNKVKIQNNVSLFTKTVVEDGVFIGPHACLTNDRYPRAINPDETLKGGAASGAGWTTDTTTVKKGAAIGANATIGPGRTIGEWALVGMGSVVTHDVPAHGLVMGNPARLKGFVCKCGQKADKKSEKGSEVVMKCAKCGEEFSVKASDYSKIRK